MLFVDLTLPALAENLAFEEAILDEADAGNTAHELLRVWTFDQPFVVLGRSSRVDQEVDRLALEAAAVPIFRRVSGGATVMAGPGCLFYALLLSLVARPELRMIDCAHRYVMSNMVKGLRALVPGIDFSGTCDLVVGDRKVSGNSVRIGRDWMLYHGTFLLDMDLAALDRWLKHPPREPEYRAHRTHSQFVANLHLSAADVKSALKSNWQAQETDWEIPRDKIKRLVADKYSQATWNYQR